MSFFFFSSRRRHTRLQGDWSSDVCSSDLRFGSHPNPPPTVANLWLDPLYTLWGLSQGAAGLIGKNDTIGLLVLAAAATAIGWHWVRGGADAFSVSVAAGLVAFYLITGLTRAQLGFQQAGSSRYVY